MPHTPEQRSAKPLCGAKARTTGKPCRKFAGEQTDHPGYGKCFLHGGRTESHNKAAVALQAQQRMITLGAPLDHIHPAQALDGLLRATAGHVNWLRQEITEMSMEDLGKNEAAVILKMYQDERDRLARIADVAMKAGLTAEQVQLEQKQAEAMSTLLRTAAAEAGLNNFQSGALGAAFHKVLAMQGVGDDPEKVAEVAAQHEVKLAKLRGIAAKHEILRIHKEAKEWAETHYMGQAPADIVYPPQEWVPNKPAA